MAQPQSDELTDVQILEFSQKIKQEEASKRPLVGPVEPIEALRAEYKDSDSPFRLKINWLERQRGLSKVRRLRGDGSCFYRALTFQLTLQACVLSKDPDSSATQLVSLLQRAQRDIDWADAEIVNDFAEPLYELLNKRPLPTEEQLVEAFNDNEISNSAIVFIRLVTSANLRRNANDILPFLFSYENDIRVLDPNTGLPSVENFCTTYVEAADSEADHIAIQALTNALGLTLDVAQLDQSSSKDAKQEDEIPVDFVSMQGGSGAEQSMDLGGAVLLLRPGHYDLLLP